MKITKNILVELDYRLTDEDNNHLNPEEEELIYLHGGYGHVHEALEEALEGKAEDEEFKIVLTPTQAFGEYDENLVVKELLSDLPKELYVGMELDSADDDAEEEGTIYIVKEIQEEFAILDANHPLAGLTLTFEGKVVNLQALSEDEIEELLAHDHHECGDECNHEH
jgi:FKBP-type peptidyl-prolyl cis-trans isomerase SlyD